MDDHGRGGVLNGGDVSCLVIPDGCVGVFGRVGLYGLVGRVVVVAIAG